MVRGDLQNMELFGDTWSTTSSLRALKWFLADVDKHKARVHKLDFIGAFLQAKVKDAVFLKLGSMFQNIQCTLEEPWDYWIPCMVWLTMGSYLLMS